MQNIEFAHRDEQMRGSKIKDTKDIEELYGNHEIKMSMEEHDLEII